MNPYSRGLFVRGGVLFSEQLNTFFSQFGAIERKDYKDGLAFTTQPTQYEGMATEFQNVTTGNAIRRDFKDAASVFKYSRRCIDTHTTEQYCIVGVHSATEHPADPSVSSEPDDIYRKTTDIVHCQYTTCHSFCGWWFIFDTDPTRFSPSSRS